MDCLVSLFILFLGREMNESGISPNLLLVAKRLVFVLS